MGRMNPIPLVHAFLNLMIVSHHPRQNIGINSTNKV